jgi:three-Cys-motif partner protein
MVKRQRFGGDWTQEKLERVRKYLHAYTTIFARNPRARKLKRIYVDAFAGSGYRTTARQESPTIGLFSEFAEADTQAFLKGSARIALEVDPPFHKYLFIEQDPDYAQQLYDLKLDFPDMAARIEIIESDANTYIRQWCATTDWRANRAVVFLDPYGMQVDWAVIKAIAETNSIDLWILFPIGMAINRLLTTDGPPPDEWQKALTKIFGTDEWRTAFYGADKNLDLFGDARASQVKLADFRTIGAFFVDRLMTIFAGVANNPLPLMNSKNNPLYLLCFASGNPRGAPTAIKIANDILKG